MTPQAALVPLLVQFGALVPAGGVTAGCPAGPPAGCAGAAGGDRRRGQT